MQFWEGTWHEPNVKINSGPTPNSLKVSAFFAMFFHVGEQFGSFETSPGSALQPSDRKPSGTSLHICTTALWNLTRYLCTGILSEPLIICKGVSAPQPSRTSLRPISRLAICWALVLTLAIPVFVTRSHASASRQKKPEPSRTSSPTCIGTLRNLISDLPRNSPEPHGVSWPKRAEPHHVFAPEPSEPHQIS